jgi:prevent-host-death family protein
MIHATIFEAKTTLSHLVKQVRTGEQVVITSGREKTPVAQLIPMVAPEKKRLGAMVTPGFTLPRDFFEPLAADELALWEGGE